MYMYRQEGFTLIELLIVLAIMGILVGVVAMSVNGLTATAQERGSTSELEIVRTVVDTYNSQKVLVDGEPTIVARSPAARILISDTNSSGEVPFLNYLKRDTKYWYSWAEGGDPITVTVTAP